LSQKINDFKRHVPQGAYAGLFGSLALMFWIGVGAAVVKPPLEKALVFSNNCNVSAFNLDSLIAMNATTPTVAHDEE
jgi:hypothetical protein